MTLNTSNLKDRMLLNRLRYAAKNQNLRVVKLRAAGFLLTDVDNPGSVVFGNGKNGATLEAICKRLKVTAEPLNSAA